LECKHQGLDILVVHQGDSDIEKIIQEKYSDIHLIHSDDKLGASKARNLGLEYLKGKSHYGYVMTLNDCSIPNLEFIEQGLKVFRNHRDIDVICGSYLFKSGQSTNLRSGVIRGWNLMQIPEPTMIVRLSAILNLNGFDETLGTGSNTFAQSGEGADLLLRVTNEGGKVLNLNVVASKDLREIPTHSIRKDFGYGFGFSVVGKRHKMKFDTMLRIFTPILRYLFLKRLAGSPDKFLNTCAVSLGRAVGLISPSKFFPLKVGFK
jgi:glycosyltransferase involved in cell wall biosynthesis